MYLLGIIEMRAPDALKRIVDVTALLQLQTFALLQARSVGDVLERAKKAIR